MVKALRAALSHEPPSARLLSIYSNYAWNVLSDHHVGLDVQSRAANAAPKESAYWITLARMQLAMQQNDKARQSIEHLRQLNIAGSLRDRIDELENLSDSAPTNAPNMSSSKP
jgi:hypothetical protein